MTSNLLLKSFITKPNGLNQILTRNVYYKFERVQCPPLKRRRESPYIVGPYLKPDYVQDEYITNSIDKYNKDHFNYFIYKPIEVECDEDRTVKLLLLDDVEGLGVAGQTVDAKYRFGSSYLVAMKKAVYATDFDLKHYQLGPKNIQSASSALSPRTCRLLKNTIFKLPINTDVKIKPWHLSVALRLGGCVCPEDAIISDSIVREDIDDNEDQYIVKCNVRINNHELVSVRFSVNKAE